MFKPCVLFLIGCRASVSGGSVVLACAAGMHTLRVAEQNNTCARLLNSLQFNEIALSSVRVANKAILSELWITKLRTSFTG